MRLQYEVLRPRDVTRGGTAALPARETALLQALLVLGLYPNVAVPDPRNGSRSRPEQLYHTARVPDVLLHPSSTAVVGADERAQRAAASAGGSGGSGGGRGSILHGGGASSGSERPSARPELLVYATLLRTKKTYLTGAAAVSALPALLLCAVRVDASEDCTRLLVDNWLAVDLPSESERAAALVGEAHALRRGLSRLLRARLPQAGCEAPLSDLPSRLRRRLDASPLVPLREMARSEREPGSLPGLDGEALAERLAQFFLAAPPRHSLRSVPRSQLASLFVLRPPARGGGAAGGRESEADVQQRAADALQEEIAAGRSLGASFDACKGGALLTPWFCWASARAEAADSAGYSAHMKRHTRCSQCGAALIVSLAELRAHQASEACREAAAARAADEGGAADEGAADREAEGAADASGPGQLPEEAEGANAGARTRYACDLCEKEFLFTATEVLRHVARHRQEADAEPDVG